MINMVLFLCSKLSVEFIYFSWGRVYLVVRCDFEIKIEEFFSELNKILFYEFGNVGYFDLWDICEWIYIVLSLVKVSLESVIFKDSGYDV